jgi:restriction endonuclease fold toxin 2 of polymorphic toxin system/pretoxin HINT domain-containing protein
LLAAAAQLRFCACCPISSGARSNNTARTDEDERACATATTRSSLMTATRVKAAAALLLVALVAVGGFIGLAGSGPDEQERARARAMLSSALDELSKEALVRYRGGLPGSAATMVDAQVTRSGIALGTMQLGHSRVRVLAVDGKRFVRADAAFWSRHGAFQPSLARIYASRWVQVGPQTVPAVAALRTPAQLATWLRASADPDAAEMSDARVDGAKAKRIDFGEGAVYVTPAKPYRVLRILRSEDSGGKSTAAVPGSLLLASASAAEDSEGADFAVQYDALIDDVKSQTRKLDKAVNPQIRFTNTPAFSCATGGTCTASTSVSNIVTGEGKASGRITVTLTASMTALGQTLQCSAQTAMLPNATTRLSCSASFRTPPSRTRVTVPVVGSLHTTAAANVMVNKIVQALERDRASAACSFSGETLVLMADGTKKPISRVRVGELVAATDPESGERSARRVTRVWVHEDRLMPIVLGGEVLATTEDHPFWNVTDQEWDAAEDLGRGDLVETADRGYVSVDRFIASRVARAPAYNLTVDTVRTYHVGRLGLLVHNTCKRLTPRQQREAASYLDGLTKPGSTDKKATPTKSPANQYEIRHTGPYNLTLRGGGTKIDADGFRARDGFALDAKHVGNPQKSPSIPGSKAFEPLRQRNLRDLRSELRRYRAVIEDSANPVRGLEIITNNQEAAAFFKRELRRARVPGRVVVRP